MRKNQHRRGTAYVEALIVVGLFTFLWVTTLTLGRLYSTKLADLFHARTASWVARTSPCRGAGDPLKRALDEMAHAPDAAHAQAVLEAAAQARSHGACAQPASTHAQRWLSALKGPR